MKKPKLENGEEWKCRECGVTTAPFTSHKKHKEILEAIDEINYGEVLKSNVFVKDKFEIKGKVSKLVENGEVIERFEKKFGFNLWKEVQGFARGENEPAEVKVGKGWINISNDVKQFIYYALNQQREQIVGKIDEIKINI